MSKFSYSIPAPAPPSEEALRAVGWMLDIWGSFRVASPNEGDPERFCVCVPRVAFGFGGRTRHAIASKATVVTTTTYPVRGAPGPRQGLPAKFDPAR